MKYPIGIQSFDDIINGGYVYIDKTRQIYDLATTGKYYFLSRPRRFGKSLLLSTIQAYFEGRRELFRGLAIDELEQDWAVYPVIYIDINSGKYYNEEGVTNKLDDLLAPYEKLYGTEPTETDPALRFGGIIRRAAEQTGHNVVILIDEYDKPMLETINDPAMQEHNRRELKAFYSQLKTQDRYIRFAFMTGVTRFSHVSIFSDLNNLKDISVWAQYADLCGMTEEEIRRHFDEPVSQIATNNKITKDECYTELRRMYDGYHFSDESETGVYNPFSLLCAMDSLRLDSYWFATGTPTFLVDLFRDSDYDIDNLFSEPKSMADLTEMDEMRRDPVSVLYQSGYLTIIGKDSESGFYWLNFPNREVEKGFLEFLVPYYWKKSRSSGTLMVIALRRDVLAGRPEAFMERLRDFFDCGDYHVVGDKELYFQNSMFIIFRMLGLDVQVEKATARGRIDVLITTDDYIYIIELKVDCTPDEALQQIRDRGYADRFASDKRRMFLIGVNFCSESRTIGDYKIV